MAKKSPSIYLEPSSSLSQLETIKHYAEQFDLPATKHFLEEIYKRYLESSKRDALDFVIDFFEENRLWKEEERIKTSRIQSKMPYFVSLESLNFAEQPELDRERILNLAKNFVEKGVSIGLFGPAGAGKTELALAFGDEAIKRGHKVRFLRLKQLEDSATKSTDVFYKKRLESSLLLPRVLILDDIDDVNLSEPTKEILGEIIYRRYENNLVENNESKLKYPQTSIIFTSNVHFSDWVNLFSSKSMAQKIIDRIADKRKTIIVKLSRAKSHRIEPPTGKVLDLNSF